MVDIVAVIVLAGVLAAVAGGLAGLVARARRRHIGGDLMAPFEEIWHPAALRARIEVRSYEQLADAQASGSADNAR